MNVERDAEISSSRHVPDSDVGGSNSERLGREAPEPRPEDLLTVSRATTRALLAVSLFFVLLGVWSWSNRVEFVAPLGEGVVRSEELGKLRIVRLGESLPMSSDSDRHWVLSYGFDTPEPDGTWIVERQANLIFTIEDGRPSRLTLNLYPFLAGDVTARDIEVRTSAEVISASLVDGINTVVVALDGKPNQNVEVSCETVDSPLELGVGMDERTLCAKLLQLQVDGE